MLNSLEQRLASFNRKERFLLVGQALGNSAFTLGDTFRQQLAQVLQREVPEDAYCAMDYHLDWLFAALMWAEGFVHPGNVMERTTDTDVGGGPQDLKVTGNPTRISTYWSRGPMSVAEDRSHS